MNSLIPFTQILDSERRKKSALLFITLPGHFDDTVFIRDLKQFLVFSKGIFSFVFKSFYRKKLPSGDPFR
jgi:hypothetical protein